MKIPDYFNQKVSSVLGILFVCLLSIVVGWFSITRAYEVVGGFQNLSRDHDENLMRIQNDEEANSEKEPL